MQVGSQLDAIIFDKDGTLFDFEKSWSGWAVDVLEHLERVVPNSRMPVAKAIGFDLERRTFTPESVVIAGSASDVEVAAAPFLPQGFDLISVLDDYAVGMLPVPVPGLHDALTMLGAGRTLGVVTNDSEVPAHAHLATHRITHHFDFIAGYDSGFGAKPAPGQLLGFCEATGAIASSSAMVGDSRHDLEAGRAAGMVTIGVLTGMARRDDLSDLADVVLPDISHIAGWLTAR
ncbi:MAG: HAD family hydrolase [Boseongicola sp.]|nr:HAD family hydrolase [Boseongicola sp.]NNL19193.1 HAD family hydrolase [Boseongicola sp.]